MKKQITILFLVISFVSNIFTFQVMAEEINDSFYVETTTNTPFVGEEFEIAVGLKDYASSDKKIRGLQVDIEGIDSSVFEVVEHSTNITGDNLTSNKTSYSEPSNRVRYLYASMSDTLEQTATELMRVKLKVKGDITEAGIATLPMTVMIVYEGDVNVTQISEISISYEKKISNISITWGAMNFTYDDGTWNTETHEYEGGAWVNEEGANEITVANTGNGNENISLTYQSSKNYSNITGSFTYEGNGQVPSYVPINVGGMKKFYLGLNGKPNKEFEKQTIGTITIGIGGGN